ncbi:putative cation efflux system protein [Vibrio angustum S14]|nr:putative cation efflux system protein [Vibrio angustum S14] [Photobacterium angustum S14]
MATTGTADTGGHGELAALKAEAMVTGPVAGSDYLIVLPVVICFIFGAALLMMRKRTNRQPWIAIPGLVLLFAVDLALLAKVATEGTQTMMMGGWKPPFGIAFTVDLMGALFVTVTGFVALACGIYAVASISPTERRYGFYPFLFLMIGGVSGAFLTGDIFNLYVWLEVLLIG